MPKTNSVPGTIVALWMVTFLAAISRVHSGPDIVQLPIEPVKYSAAASVGVTTQPAPEAKR